MVPIQGLRIFGLVSLTRFPSSTLLPFFFWVPLLKPNSRKKGTLIIKGLLGNLAYYCRTPKALFDS